MNRTKIVCTIGPSSWDPKTLEELIKAGLDCARLNFSHGFQEEKEAQINLIRSLSKKLNKPIAIIADLQGPKLRLGNIDGIREIKKGENINLSLSPITDELPIQFNFAPFIKKNQRIFLNDGLVELKVTSVNGSVIKTIAQNDGVVSSNKGINIPDTLVKKASFTDKDYEDAQFALKQGVDYLALSFVQTVDDLSVARKLIKQHNPQTQIIVKIEKQQALDNLEEIIKATDAVMVARGDLGIEIKASQVPIFQQKMIALSRQYQKPIIVATQMLESMIENPRPTRAETSDVANAVLDQVDAVMLSGESASGKYPLEAVRTMHDIIESVESFPEYKRSFSWQNIPPRALSTSALSSSAVTLTQKIGAKVIAVGTKTGATAKTLASFRPEAKIIAIVHDDDLRNQLQLVWGMQSITIPSTQTSDELWTKIVNNLKQSKELTKGDRIVITSGAQIGVSGTTDTIKVITVK